MKKNDIVAVKIDGMSAEGRGVGRADNIAIFIPQTALGDVAEVRVLKVKSKYAFGKVENLIKPSQDRVVSDCEVFGRCGGCVYRHINYESECRIKETRVKDAITRIAAQNILPKPIVFSDNITRYRNKAQYPVLQGGKTGFFAPHSHRGVECDDCLLQPQEFTTVAKILENWIIENNISVYDETTKKGLVRHLYMRKAFATGELMVVLVVNGQTVKGIDEFVMELRAELGDALVSVMLNINTKDTNVVLSDCCKTVFGQNYITDVLCGVKIRLSPLSFYQVNHEMAQRLYEKVAEYAEVSGKTVLDLYCGTGTIGLSLAKNAEKIIGVEIVPDAIEDAKKNSQQNGFSNTEFICADASQAAEQLNKQGIKPDVVIVDPPRKGCNSSVLNTIANGFNPEKIVYVSCDPATLARDVAILNDMGYSLVEYTPFDLFPRTSHVETVALLNRN